MVDELKCSSPIKVKFPNYVPQTEVYIGGHSFYIFAREGRSTKSDEFLRGAEIMSRAVAIA